MVRSSTLARRVAGLVTAVVATVASMVLLAAGTAVAMVPPVDPASAPAGGTHPLAQPAGSGTLLWVALALVCVAVAGGAAFAITGLRRRTAQRATRAPATA